MLINANVAQTAPAHYNVIRSAFFGAWGIVTPLLSDDVRHHVASRSWIGRRWRMSKPRGQRSSRSYNSGLLTPGRQRTVFSGDFSGSFSWVCCFKSFWRLSASQACLASLSACCPQALFNIPSQSIEKTQRNVCRWLYWLSSAGQSSVAAAHTLSFGPCRKTGWSIKKTDQ